MNITKNQVYTRRDFLIQGSIASMALILPAQENKPGAMDNFDLGIVDRYPYLENSMQPYLSPRTLNLHFHKHYMNYVKRLKMYIVNTPYSKLTAEEIIKQSVSKAEERSIYINAVLAWNHNFYWNSMKPKGGGEPGGVVKKAIINGYGSLKTFKKRFLEETLKGGVHGWMWLVRKDNTIAFQRTQYIKSPQLKNLKPLAVIDLWEHAFYLDYENRFEEYVSAFINNLIHWEFVDYNFK